MRLQGVFLNGAFGKERSHGKATKTAVEAQRKTRRTTKLTLVIILCGKQVGQESRSTCYM